MLKQWYGMVWLILNYAVVIQRKGLFIRYGDDWVDELDMPDFCILYVTTDDVVRSTEYGLGLRSSATSYK